MEAIELYKEESSKLAQHEAECKTAGKQVGGWHVYVFCDALKRSSVVECSIEGALISFLLLAFSVHCMNELSTKLAHSRNTLSVIE